MQTSDVAASPRSDDVRAAGAVVTRRAPDGERPRQVLLVHRPRYDDWSFPKGKLDPGEHATTAAVREVAEETGLDVRLGPPLQAQRYRVGPRMKTVHYWVGRVLGDGDVSRYAANDEIDRVVWCDVDEAAERLTYPHDRETLRESALVRKNTRALVLLRHGKAQARTAWSGPDTERPLATAGALQAQLVVPLLAAYDVARLVSSPSARCHATLAPYAEVTGLPVALAPEISEADHDPVAAAELVRAELAQRTGVVLCSHRPVLPDLLEAAGVPAGVRLDPGSLLVVHHRRGRVVATERHDLPVRPA